MSVNVNKWRVVITANQAEDFVWRDENQDAPVVGPTGEPIDTAKSRIVEVREQNEVIIQEEKIKTGGNFKFESIKITAAANTITEQDFSWEIPINVISATIVTSADMTGDLITWLVAPNITIGGITSDISISNTVINVSQTVVDNIKIGFKIRVANAADPANAFEDLGIVLNVDKDNFQITVSTAATQAWAAALPTLVQMSVYYIENAEIGPPAKIEIGKDKIGASYLPANTILRAYYDNKHVTDAKTFYAYVEYLY